MIPIYPNIQNTYFSKNTRILLVHFLLPFSFSFSFLFPFPRSRLWTRDAGLPCRPGSSGCLRLHVLLATPVVLALVLDLVALLVLFLIVILADFLLLFLTLATLVLTLPCVIGLLATPAHMKTYEHPIILPQVLVLSDLLILVPYRFSRHVSARRGTPRGARTARGHAIHRVPQPAHLVKHLTKQLAKHIGLAVHRLRDQRCTFAHCCRPLRSIRRQRGGHQRANMRAPRLTACTSLAHQCPPV